MFPPLRMQLESYFWYWSLKNQIHFEVWTYEGLHNRLQVNKQTKPNSGR